MAPKKRLKNLSKKGLKKAGAVKGGRKKLAGNHNLTVLD